MDDINVFERLVADEMQRRAGPDPVVDDAAIFSAITATQSPKWRFQTMFSALKFVVAGAIVALFGVFLLQGILPTQVDENEVPAAVTESPSAMATDGSTFPTGTFTAEGDDLTLEFRADGTCDRAGTPCTYGVDGPIYAEMTFEDQSGPQVPATYLWHFDGERLTFEPRDHDPRPLRRETYVDHVYSPVGDTRPLVAAEPGFPTGWFVSADDGDSTLTIHDNGLYAADEGGGKFVVNGSAFTSMPIGADQRYVAATYDWEWDGERLTFRPWGEDDDPARLAFLAQVFTTDGAAPPPRRLLLSDPRLDFFVTVEIQALPEGQYAVTATVDEEPLGDGVGDTPQAAVKAALESLGEPLAGDIAAKVPS